MVLNDHEVKKIAEPVLRQILGSYRFSDLAVRSGTDHDGDDAIFVTVDLERDTPVIPGSVSSEAAVGLSQALLGRGDPRFPYLHLRHVRAEDDADERDGLSLHS